LGQTANILIVDDYAPNILALKVTLEGPQNYKLFEAASGMEAINLCKKHEFALIILDIQMPDLDGFETARAIKNCAINKETPIIFVTAFYQADPFVQKGYEAGAIDYFGKPFEPSILKAKVGIYTELYLKTKRIQETASLLRSHDQIKTLLDNIPVGIVVADVHGYIFENNDEAHQIWGGIKRCRVEELDQYKGWHGESGQRLRAEDWALTRALKSGEISKEELVKIECFDGTRKTIWNSAYPIKGKDGETVAAVAVFQDVETTAAEISGAQKKWKSCLTLLSS
jgi:CheY-like chemotaxis protein